MLKNCAKFLLAAFFLFCACAVILFILFVIFCWPVLKVIAVFKWLAA